MEIKYNRVSYSCTDNATFIKTILSNINLNISEKSITAIMGTCDMGKSTLIQMMSGYITPTNGEVTVGNNTNEEIKNIQSKIGIVHQNIEDCFFMNTVSKELLFTIKHSTKKNKNIEKHAIDSLTMVGLNEDYLNRDISSLSKGEKIKLAIALILSVNPKVIILDEPTIDLDSDGVNKLVNLLKRLKTSYGKTIVVVSKDSDFVHKIADKVVILDNGKIVLSGTKFDVFTQDIEKYGLKMPKIIQFEKMVRDRKKIRLLYRDEINDLMKDIYRYVEK